MGLKEFEFIDESIDILRSMTPTLEMIAKEIQQYYEEILKTKNQEYINVTSRVKDESSLREKIIRNRYLKKYNEADILIYNLSDLIGIRIECRFIEDEKNIYRLLKRYFNKTDDKIYYYNKENKNIQLKLCEKQPSKQKNGFEIYRIDGMFTYLDRQVKFELQIKSLVNIFWSEIEHKIIYKNNTYLLSDVFLSDMMTSIKNNLTMIDNQLLSIYKNFSTGSITNIEKRKKEIEKILAKMAHDVFSSKMRESIGFVVDFKKPCETILSYSFNKNESSEDSFGEILLEGISRLNNISKKDINFTEDIRFELEPEFEDIFCKKLGKYIKDKLNTEFGWNLFFRILFEIEPYNNKQDFENFITFIKEKVMSIENQGIILKQFENYGEVIINDIYKSISESIILADRVETMYDYNLDNINFISTEMIMYIARECSTYNDYMEKKDEIITKIKNKILQLFE